MKSEGIIQRSQKAVTPRFEGVDELAEYNQLRVLKGMQECRISDTHFAPTTGYGYGDEGRTRLEELYALVFGSQDALVRPQWGSGTHVISDALYAVLRPGDVLVSITGKPYDTLEKTIGLDQDEPPQGSLMDWGISYNQIELDATGEIDTPKVLNMLDNYDSIKAILIQRSRGYQWRSSISVYDMEQAISKIKEKSPNVFIIVDNCYGEFTQGIEPSHIGADLTVGSLIKNPGGGLTPTGAYAVGTKEAIELLSYRLTSPAIGREVGSYAASYLPFFQGLFMAPHVVGQALKGAILASHLFKALGYEVLPHWEDERGDIIQCIKFGSDEELIAFCQAIQQASPVDGHVTPVPWEMPGYTHEVIMAAGTFIQGASIELSADAPITPPYIAYLQGGLTYAHVKLALSSVISRLYEGGFVSIKD
ncbi:MAG TPA: methionine gamma-lyase family protein [Clostridia bacterium]|nr:methionine gamma-lyase family protein [Clostridia bacterium]